LDNRAKLHPITPGEYRRLPFFDMDRPPIRQRGFLRPVTWLLSFPAVWKHRTKIRKSGLGGIKPPFVLLCTHMGFTDFKVTTAALFPWRTNYVVAIDGFIGREGLLRNAGGILKRRVVGDVKLVRHLRQVLDGHRDVVSIYPEARYSLIGVPAEIPESLGKMLKLFKVPVVLLRMHGIYLDAPVWNLKERGCPIEAEMVRLFSAEELAELDVAAVNVRIRKAYEYDEYRWQRDNRVRIDFPERAEGLHRVIYQCPACGEEFRMESSGARLRCGACGKEWEMDEWGSMRALTGETEFPRLPDWYRFQEANVRREIDAGTYRFEDDVRVESLANEKGYYDLGTARVIHDRNGFRMTGDPAFFPEPVVKKPASMYSCHIEYQYFGKGDAFELSTMNETFYLYPLNARNVVTKILIATEELHRRDRAKA